MTKIMRLFALMASMALLMALAPSATAEHSTGWPNNARHENQPTKQVPADVDPDSVGNCVVDGQVDTHGDGDVKNDRAKPTGSGMVPSHGHYAFRQASLECPTGPFADDYIVVAWGAADGPCQVDPVTPGKSSPICQPGPGTHGSTTAISWSHSGRDLAGANPGPAGTSKDNPGGGFNHGTHCGIAPNNQINQNSITATPVGGGDTSHGWVKFIRVAGDAEAWGQFCDGPLGGLKFTAELAFTPVVPSVPNVFDLTGTAVTFCGNFVPADPNKPKGSGLACP